MSARYVYDDAHNHRLTIAAGSTLGLSQPYVSLSADCMDIGGDMANVWLPVPDVERLAGALAERVPFEYTDHMGDTVMVAPAPDWTTFTVVRAAREDGEVPVTVRVVVLTTRLSEVRAGLVAALPAPAGSGPGGDPIAVGRSLDLLALMDEGAASVVSPVLAAVLDEVEQWRAAYGRDSLPGALARLERAEARVAELEAERHSTNEALDDAVQALREREKRDAVVADFVAKRAEYITAIRNCHPDNGHDYDRWQGHAAARRQLAELLGLPVVWPPEDVAAVAKSADKLTALLAPTQALRDDEPAEELTVFRAGFDGHDIPLGTYSTPQAARAHCEAYVRREYPAGTGLVMTWAADEDDPNVVELDVEAGGRTESTGYIVTALEVPSDYDEDADE